jgi:hypothetical protein
VEAPNRFSSTPKRCNNWIYPDLRQTVAGSADRFGINLKGKLGGININLDVLRGISGPGAVTSKSLPRIRTNQREFSSGFFGERGWLNPVGSSLRTKDVACNVSLPVCVDENKFLCKSKV